MLCASLAHSASHRAPTPQQRRRRQADEKKWDVTADLGPTKKLAFDTSEGTWMNVDVSPDGRAVVFDLLGDLYMMPIGGSGASPATRITSGPAFDMQPRFSPDGKRIAFSSDRDGLWNIWTIDADGKDAKQVSKREALVRQQSDLVAGRQLHLRAAPLRRGALARRRRDLDVPRQRIGGPAGHREERLPEGRRRAGGFARRPLPLLQQGRHARASSSNTTRIRTATIYAIIRRDLTTGRERPIVSVQGGSVTPRPSPRRQVARLRPPRAAAEPAVRARPRDRPRPRRSSIISTRICRRRGRSTGSIRSTRGCPTARRSSIWGEGKIWRVDVASGEGDADPVHRARRADAQRRACAFRRRSTRRSSRSRCCATSRRRRTGSSVAYGALGHIYVKSAAGRRAEAA